MLWPSRAVVFLRMFHRYIITLRRCCRAVDELKFGPAHDRILEFGPETSPELEHEKVYGDGGSTGPSPPSVSTVAWRLNRWRGSSIPTRWSARAASPKSTFHAFRTKPSPRSSSTSPASACTGAAFLQELDFSSGSSTSLEPMKTDGGRWFGEILFYFENGKKIFFFNWDFDYI